MSRISQVYAALFGFVELSWFHQILYRLSLRGLGVQNYENLRVSGESWLLDKIIQPLGSDLTIFDVGANVGDYSKLLSKKVPEVKHLYAFEPHPTTYPLLLSNTQDIGCLTCVNVALSDRPGQLVFYDRADKQSSSHASFHSGIFSGVHGIAHVEHTVTAKTLDQFCFEHTINRIDFLKLDVEGHELEVLKGAGNMLRDGKIGIIQFEFTQLNAVVGVFFKQYWDLLSEQYNIYRLLPHGLLRIRHYDPTNCEVFGYQNFIAISGTSKIVKRNFGRRLSRSSR
jgi:FkbM family methyltransferase